MAAGAPRPIRWSASSPLVKDKEGAEHDARKSRGVIPPEFFSQIHNGENGEDRERDDFLDSLELRAVKFVRADAVRGHLETVFEEGDPPTREYYLPERFAAVFQVPVPRKGHENVGDSEQ